MITCHICENETDFYCEICKEPVCEDCCVVPTYMNQIDYALCTDCQDAREADDQRERNAEYRREEAVRIKKEKRKKISRENYWKPENIEKRRKAKEERRRLRAELKKKQIEQTIKMVNSMFRGINF